MVSNLKQLLHFLSSGLEPPQIIPEMRKQEISSPNFIHFFHNISNRDMINLISEDYQHEDHYYPYPIASYTKLKTSFFILESKKDIAQLIQNNDTDFSYLSIDNKQTLNQFDWNNIMTYHDVQIILIQKKYFFEFCSKLKFDHQRNLAMSPGLKFKRIIFAQECHFLENNYVFPSDIAWFPFQFQDIIYNDELFLVIDIKKEDFLKRVVSVKMFQFIYHDIPISYVSDVFSKIKTSQLTSSGQECMICRETSQEYIKPASKCNSVMCPKCADIICKTSPDGFIKCPYCRQNHRLEDEFVFYFTQTNLVIPEIPFRKTIVAIVSNLNNQLIRYLQHKYDDNIILYEPWFDITKLMDDSIEITDIILLKQDNLSIDGLFFFFNTIHSIFKTRDIHIWNLSEEIR